MEKFNVTEVCEMLTISQWTLTNWYQWQRSSLASGEMTEPMLPIPTKDKSIKGQPRFWTMDQVEQLREFQSTMPRGRNGRMGKFTNPKSRHAKSKTSEK